MRTGLIFLLVLVGSIYAGCTLATAKSTFVQKLIKIAIAFWNEKNLGQISDAVIEDVRTQKTMEQIGDNGMNYVVPNTPILDYSKLMTLMSAMDKCLQGTNSKTMDVIKLALPVFMDKLKAPYQKIKQKTKAMQAAKKTKDQQTCQAYTLAASSFSKPFVQKIITACSKKMSKQQWNCSIANLQTIIRMSLYDTKKAA